MLQVSIFYEGYDSSTALIPAFDFCGVEVMNVVVLSF